jgi:hypothetical protein
MMNYHKLILLINELNMKNIILAFLIVIIYSLDSNYQERILYYDEHDNVCAYSDYTDWIFLVVTFSDRQQIEKNIRGGTNCDAWNIRYINRLKPSSTMSYYECPEDQNYCDRI